MPTGQERMTHEEMVRAYPRSMLLVVYPNKPNLRYDATVVGHTATTLRVRVETPEVRKYRSEYTNVKPHNVVPRPDRESQRLHILQLMCNGDKHDARVMSHLTLVWLFEFPWERVHSRAGFLGLHWTD